MQAEIDDKGQLQIIPTTLTEETALRAWKEKAYVQQENPALNESGTYRGSLVVLKALPKRQPST